MVELIQSGRSPQALAKEFEPTAQTIRNWGCASRRQRRQTRLAAEQAEISKRTRSGRKSFGAVAESRKECSFHVKTFFTIERTSHLAYQDLSGCSQVQYTYVVTGDGMS